MRKLKMNWLIVLMFLYVGVSDSTLIAVKSIFCGSSNNFIDVRLDLLSSSIWRLCRIDHPICRKQNCYGTLLCSRYYCKYDFTYKRLLQKSQWSLQKSVVLYLIIIIIYFLKYLQYYLNMYNFLVQGTQYRNRLHSEIP